MQLTTVEHRRERGGAANDVVQGAADKVGPRSMRDGRGALEVIDERVQPVVGAERCHALVCALGIATVLRAGRCQVERLSERIRGLHEQHRLHVSHEAFGVRPGAWVVVVLLALRNACTKVSRVQQGQPRAAR